MRSLSVTCVRCDSRAAYDGDLCPLCSFATRLEAARGLRRLSDYLAHWAAFEEWARGRSPTAGAT